MIVASLQLCSSIEQKQDVLSQDHYENNNNDGVFFLDVYNKAVLECLKKQMQIIQKIPQNKK